jgi:flavin reductase (DIM6/NTAB) family NADH-FMN oxidoreductase RutF
MQPWEEVVRYKSFAGFSVEICIPDHIIAQIEEQGPLQSLLNLHDLQIDVGETVINRTGSGMGVPVRSMLCTGTVEDIEVVRNKFRKLQNRLAALDDGDTRMGRQGAGNHAILQHQDRTATEDLGGGQTKLQGGGGEDNIPRFFRRKPMLYDDDVKAKQHQGGNDVGTQVWRHVGGPTMQHRPLTDTTIVRERQQLDGNRNGNPYGNGNSNGNDSRLERRLQAIETFLAETRQQRKENHANTEPRKRPLHSDNGRPATKQREANHASLQRRSHRTARRTENDGGTTSEPPGDPAIKQDSDRTDLEGHNIYFLEVQPQKRLTTDPEEVPFSWPPGFGEQLRGLKQRTRIEIRNSSPVIRLEGRLASIEEARRVIQSIVDQKCDSMAIPRRELKEIMPPTQSAEAKILLERRRQEGKQDKIKTILRPLMHPVVLVTASTRNNDAHSNAIDHLRGVTVSSFTSVSVAPKPILSFNLRLPSRTWDAIQSNATICINLLEASAEGAAIAHAFTQPHEDPTEAFRELGRLGYVLRNFSFANIKRLSKMHPSGRLDVDSAIFGWLFATVKRDRCVKVGDHVIVVAEVVSTMMANNVRERATAGESFGLAYANREYRMLGETIEPVRIPKQDASQMERDPVTPDVSSDIDDSHTGDEVGRQVYEQPFVSENATNNIRLNDEQTPSSTDETIPPGKEDLTSLHTMQTVTSPSVEQMCQSLEELEAAGAVDHDASAIHDQLSSKVAPAPPSTTRAPASSTSPPGPRSSSDSPMSFLRRMWRGYSTSAKSSTSTDTHLEPSTTAEADQLESKVSDKSLFSTTAREYLNSHDDDPYVPRRMRAMMKAKKQAHDAAKQLERALANGTLTAEESERLENIITRNERWLAKKLAFNSAYDLRLMLDKGKVDVKRAQWLESSIEKGQAVLLDEIRQVRTLYDDGKLDEAKYKIAKGDLEKDNLILATEAMRLRQMVDEEADEGGVAPDDRGFDGFKGNV